jgi:hypothetical protein
MLELTEHTFFVLNLRGQQRLQQSAFCCCVSLLHVLQMLLLTFWC